MELETRLLKRKRDGNLRQLQVVSNLIDFASNDYLGLSRSFSLAASIKKELNRNISHLNGYGSTGSRLLTGNSNYAEDLENKISARHGFQAGLLFSSGYMANVGLLSTVATENDSVFFDIGIHASTRDGMRLSRAKTFGFRHNDPAHLEKKLKNHKTLGNRFICIESIYSTDGSIAPILEISKLAKEYNAHLIVDEAHAIGTFGAHGLGLVAEANLTPYVFAEVVTFGKALGTHGAIVLGSNVLKQALLNFATPCIYTTALPLHSLAAIKCSYEFFPQLAKERMHLQTLIQIFHKNMKSPSTTPIQAVRFEGNEKVKKAAEQIRKAGFDVRPLMSPTVHKKAVALRICLHAFNKEDEVRLLLEHLKPYV